MILPRPSGTRAWRLAVLAIALTVLALGLARGAWTIGGADSYGYVSQASLWRSGRALTPQALLFDPPWPGGAWSLAPLGYRPSVDRRGIVPIYPPGLPMVMAAASAIGGDRAVHVLAPIAGALAILLVAAIGRRIGGPAVGLSGALMLAASPTLLYQIVQPMSDVPVMACWLAAVFWAASGRRGAVVAAGVISGLAILIRPNLAPLAAVPLGLAVLRAPSGRARVGAGLAVALPCACAVGVIAAVQATLYGSALMSGYGPADLLYSADRVADNFWRYVWWLSRAHTPLILIGFAWPLAAARVPNEARTLGWGCWVLAAMCLGLYLPYVTFDDWWYTRFLLPALALLLVLSAAIAQRRRYGRFLLPLVVVVIVTGEVAMSVTTRVLSLRDGEQRYPRFAQVACALTPPDAAIITLQHSGALRTYADRVTLRWDVIPPEWLDRAIAYLRAQGRPPFLAIEDAERRAFVGRFGAVSRYGRLDWAPLLCRDGTCLFDPAQADDVRLQLAR